MYRDKDKVQRWYSFIKYQDHLKCCKYFAFLRIKQQRNACILLCTTGKTLQDKTVHFNLELFKS